VWWSKLKSLWQAVYDPEPPKELLPIEEKISVKVISASRR
jgi:hypothetical protein